MIRAIVVSLFLALYILVLGPPYILHCLLTRRPDVLYFVGLGGAKLAMRLSGIRVRAEGLENIPPGVCLFVGNHTSNVDPPAVAAAIPRRVALLGKKEVFRIPILGRALLLVNFVPVDRADREAAAASVEMAIQHLRDGVSFLIFPEGTRSPDGRLRSFKKGTFVMAIKAGVPIVPVSVIDAHKRMARRSTVISPGEVRVRFHKPVSPEGYTLERRAELSRKVFDAVASGLPADQKPHDSVIAEDAAEASP